MTSAASLREVADVFTSQYSKTPAHLKVLDSFAACAVATALLQFVYATLVGTFPFNSFLAGFFCCVGTAVLTVSLRMQASADEPRPTAQAFAEYALAMCVLFLAAWNYIG